MMKPMDQSTTPETHTVSHSICLHKGTTCPALARMLRALATALDKARPVTDTDFEICGESLLDGCTRHCPARFVATHERIRVFCDVTNAADPAALNRFADTMFHPTDGAVSASLLPERPCAIGEALPKPPQKSTAERTPNRVASSHI